MSRLIFAICFLFFVLSSANGNGSSLTVAVLDFGDTDFGRQAAEKLRVQLRGAKDLSVADADLTRSAAKGSGYAGSLNLTLTEARDLGAALATDFFVLGDAQVLRRSSFESPVYFEAYCTVFVVSSRTGRLLMWVRPSFKNASATQAQSLLSDELSANVSQSLRLAMLDAHQTELKERIVIPPPAPLIEDAPDDEKAAAAQGLRLPRPYRRMRPDYPASAASAEAEATVDVSIEVGADGEVGEVQIVRWAGFGLDEATLATVRQLHFFPAMKNGTAIPMRVLLRYNFRKPPR